MGKWSVRLGHCGEKGAESEGKALDLPINPRSNPQLWPRGLGNDQKNEIADPPLGGWAKGTS